MRWVRTGPERSSPMRLLEKKKRMPLRGIFWVLALLPYLLTAVSLAEEKGILWVDRFSKGVNPEGIPVGWILEKHPDSRSKIVIEGEKEDHFLHLLSVGDGFGLRKEISFKIQEYPYLSWRWKVSKLPKGGDIRKRETDDQAGQIYVMFPKVPSIFNTLAVGYIWDSQAPADLYGTSAAYNKMRYVVVQSGSAKLDQWTSETRNVYEDFKKLFHGEPPPVGGVLLYVNSQHTKSSAECFYADIFFSSHPPETPHK
jgi:hypothetical protein